MVKYKNITSTFEIEHPSFKSYPLPNLFYALKFSSKEKAPKKGFSICLLSGLIIMHFYRPILLKVNRPSFVREKRDNPKMHRPTQL